MSFLDPTYDPLGAVDDQSLPALSPNLPNAITALNRKYGGNNLTAIQQQYGAPIANSFVKWELDRAQRGVTPLSTDASIAALNAAKTHQASTPPPQPDIGDIFGNFASDIGNVVSNIPKIPGALVQEIEDLPNFAKRVQERGGGIAGLLQAPLIRLIPGTYTAANLAQGDFGELARHPGYTALDVLPYAKELGVGEKLAALPVPGAADNLGELGQRVVQAAGRTAPGRLVAEAFSPLTRKMMAGEYGQVAEITARSNPALAFLHNDDLSNLAQDSVRFQSQWNKTIPDPTRQAAISTAVETNINALDNMNLTDAERARVEQYMNLRQQYANIGADRGDIGVRPVGGQPEELASQQVKQYDALVNQRDRWNTLTQLRNAVIDPENADMAVLHDQVAASLAGDLPMSAKKNVAAGYVHALDATGYDTGDLLAQARQLTSARVEDFIANLPDVTTVTPADEPVLTRRAAGQPPLEPADRWTVVNSKYTDAGLAKREAALTRLESRIVPARWTPYVESQFNAATTGAAADLEGRPEALPTDTTATTVPVTPLTAEQRIDAAMRRDYGLLIDRGIIQPDEITQWRNEAIQSWQQARADGVEPTFVHHAPPSFPTTSRGPARITTVAPTPAQFRARAWDWTPHNNDLAVSLDSQRLNLLREDAANNYINYLSDPANGITRTRADIENELRPTAIARAQRNNISYGQAMEDLMAKSQTPFDSARTGFLTGRWGNYRTSDFAGRDDLFIPRYISDAMKRLGNPSALERTFNPVLKVFRTAVLPFSARFITNHIFGSTMMSALEDPRTLVSTPDALAAANDLRKMGNALSRGDEYTLADRTQEILKSMPPNVRSMLGSLGYSVAPADTASTSMLAKFRVGQQLGEWANQIQKVGHGFSRVADASYSVVQTADDLNRIRGYLNEYERAGGQGATAEEAAARGEALVNKIAPRWNEMTPFERSIIRPLVPFYGFMSHVLRYSYRYPIDHPFRVAIGSSLVRAEMQDFGTGLPQALASMFLIGSPDKLGNQRAVDVSGMNPFRDLTNSMTLAGFMSQTNPLVKVALTQLGYDPQARGPNLYPEVEYDPKTGRFRQVPTTTPGLLGQLVTGIIPQTSILSTLAGTNSEFRQLVRANPDAAQRMLLSSAGIPLLWRNVNVPQQAFSAEVTRQADQRAVLSAAMKTGDYSRAMRYPALVPYIHQLQILQSQGALKPYIPADNPELKAAEQQLAANVNG